MTNRIIILIPIYNTDSQTAVLLRESRENKTENTIKGNEIHESISYILCLDCLNKKV